MKESTAFGVLFTVSEDESINIMMENMAASRQAGRQGIGAVVPIHKREVERELTRNEVDF